MTPDTTNTDLRQTQLQELATKIKTFKEAKGWNWQQLKEAMPEHGSDKTLMKIFRGDFSELNLDNWLENYLSCAAQIESGLDLAEPEPEQDALLADTTLALKLREIFTRLIRVKDNNRLAIITIEGGGGKTSAAKALRAKWNNRVCLVQCLSIWNDRPGAMLHDMCVGLGVRDVPVSSHARYLKVKERLAKRTCLILDEAHYMDRRCLAVIVNLLNETPGEFIFLAKPMLWKALERSAYESVDQLKVNRLDELAQYDRLSAKDYERFLKSRLPDLPVPALAKASVALAADASARGHLAFARDTIRRAQLIAGEEPVGLQHLADASRAVSKKLGRASE